ncbi:MAG: Transcriptional repressor, BlaI/MecI family protein [Chthonomonadaceae bacterium]|nr:Transcriptional repressor, BlaI/MecI family protein [Chthonomonadaceae bacterium]
MTLTDPLSRRERQIMDILYQHQSATANEVLAALPDPCSSSAIRTLLRILEKKGHVKHTQDGLRYVYTPAHPPHNVAQHALSHLMKTFFGGSVENVVAALVSPADGRLSEEELDRLTALIAQARAEEK